MLTKGFFSVKITINTVNALRQRKIFQVFTENRRLLRADDREIQYTLLSRFAERLPVGKHVYLRYKVRGCWTLKSDDYYHNQGGTAESFVPVSIVEKIVFTGMKDFLFSHSFKQQVNQ
jgi:hypothetical protein